MTHVLLNIYENMSKTFTFPKKNTKILGNSWILYYNNNDDDNNRQQQTKLCKTANKLNSRVISKSLLITINFTQSFFLMRKTSTQVEFYVK